MSIHASAVYCDGTYAAFPGLWSCCRTANFHLHPLHRCSVSYPIFIQSGIRPHIPSSRALRIAYENLSCRVVSLATRLTIVSLRSRQLGQSTKSGSNPNPSVGLTRPALPTTRMGGGEVYAKSVLAGGLVEGALPPPTSRSSVGAGIVVVLDALVLYSWPWPWTCPTWYARALSGMM